MKITVHNLGVISEAEIDLKPLTIFVGPNNAGKTWLAYTIAAIFSEYGLIKYLEEEVKTYSLIEEAAKQFLNYGQTVFDMEDFINKYGQLYFNNVASLVRSWLPDFMGSRLTSFENVDISIELAETKANVLGRVLNISLKNEIVIGQKELLNIHKGRGDSKIFIFTSNESISSYEDISGEETDEKEQLPFNIIKELLTSTILQIVHKSLFQNVRIMPTERTTFMTFSLSPQKVSAEMVTIRPDSLGSPKSKRLAVSAGSFLSMIISTIADDRSNIKKRERDAKRNAQIRKYMRIADILEERILSGKIKILPGESNLPVEIGVLPANSTPEVLFQPTLDCQLEISLASSMVKELSSLVLYLRYQAVPGELLVIDEPEMNLHPEAQAKLIELLAMLVNTGLNILITTHSPYFIDHLNNLIKAAESENKASVIDKFYLKQTEALLSKDKVAVYLVEQGHTRNVIDEDGLIDLHTFGEISDHLSEIYFEL